MAEMCFCPYCGRSASGLQAVSHDELTTLRRCIYCGEEVVDAAEAAQYATDWAKEHAAHCDCPKPEWVEAAEDLEEAARDLCHTYFDREETPSLDAFKKLEDIMGRM